MTAHLQLLLSVWREVGRHLRIQESLANILPLLCRGMGLEGLLLRRLDVARRRLETVAHAGRVGEAGKVAPAEGMPGWDGLLAWCGDGLPIAGTAEQLAALHPGLLPLGLSGQVLAAGLVRDEAPLGVLVCLWSMEVDRARIDLATHLLEPFTAALENDRRLRELSVLREAAEADRQSLLSRLKRQDITGTVVGAESGLKEVMERVELVARSDTPVLILGETGTGKEVVARAIHQRSRRIAGPFLRVNCGAIPAELIDSELFGHERGSFTGAVATRQGWFERADGGTLFLDELGELSPAAQVRLLRVLQDGSFERVGGQQSLNVDVRVVAATHQDLHAMVGEGSFRQDLWYRVAVFPIHLPALRERPEDIPPLATHFALQAAQRLGLAMQSPSLADLSRLAAYPWPGNVRELASVMERAAILGDGRRLEVTQALGVAPGPVRNLPEPERDTPERNGFATLEALSRQHIETALERCAGRVEGPFGAARLLGVNPNTLRGRMRRLGVEPGRFRPPRQTDG